MNTTTEINLSDLYKDKAPGNDTAPGTTPLQNPEVEESLFNPSYG